MQTHAHAYTYPDIHVNIFSVSRINTVDPLSPAYKSITHWYNKENAITTDYNLIMIAEINAFKLSKYFDWRSKFYFIPSD